MTTKELLETLEHKPISYTVCVKQAGAGEPLPAAEIYIDHANQRVIIR